MKSYIFLMILFINTNFHGSFIAQILCRAIELLLCGSLIKCLSWKTEFDIAFCCKHFLIQQFYDELIC